MNFALLNNLHKKYQRYIIQITKGDSYFNFNDTRTINCNRQRMQQMSHSL